jgi:hypothetical protein
MPKMRVTMVTLFIVGVVLLLAGLLAEPSGAVGSEAPALQPSPRPTTSLPTLRPTTSLPTAGPTAEVPTTEPPSSGSGKSASQSASLTPTPTPTPSPALLPDSGGASGGAWLLGLGGGVMLLGLALGVLWQGRM